ncbi:hypothetical protein BOW86_gp210 [Synechococcus phage S-CAM7]|uniref:Uncharacterized protein n=1 Tax=Synechococcus phage S-CAM7 TaxID=1883368 RepID=A0A1D8KU32_9CAUD|nr:hypothetical protein BOW86_gp210 [Synechococcus phage S-CAM7]AOV62171.1 hypothetical protein C490910_248 [Synechococcus phage S-CAM7]AOV62437.1 hypothetical protein S420910_250 [Synechococcus phage S-CAM7]QLF86301.1 hypothetical protein CC030809_00253 [Synechococcus phage S-CAM7]
MDLNSYIQLKEAYSQVGKPQQLTENVDSIWEEVEAFAHALVEEEGLDLSDMTWDEVRDAYLQEQGSGQRGSARRNAAARANRDPEAGRTRSQQQMDAKIDKEFGSKNPKTGLANLGSNYAAQEKAAAKAAEASRGSGGSSLSSAVAEKQAKAKAKLEAQRNSGGTGATSNSKTTAKTTTKPETKTTTQTTTKTSTPAAKTQPAAPAKDRMAGASKADRMGAWAKANPKLAAAQKQRAATRGTSATTNPMMKDLAKRMPKPAAPNKPSGGGLSAVKPQSFNTSVAAGSAMKSAASKPTPKPAAPSFGAGIKAGSMLKKEEFSDFDIILTHLIEQGFGDDEALTLMVNMTEEKREEILENRRAARAAGGYKDDSKKQTDPSKDGFTGISGSIKDIMRQSAAMDKKKKQKTQKEETDSLYQAYLSMMSEEESDKRNDKHLESGGHAAKTDYSKPPATGNDFGKKKPLSDEERSAAMAKIVAKLKKQGGK